MSSPTNLTDRITHLRDRKSSSKIIRGNHSGNKSQLEKNLKTRQERRFATDFFMMVTYSLLGFAMLAQVFLIIWLDII